MLRTWLSVYPREQLLVVYYGDLVRDPRGFLAQVVAFLGVDPARAARVVLPDEPVNSAAYAASRGVPASYEAELAAMFLPELRALHAELGAPIDRWIARAESALELRAAS